MDALRMAGNWLQNQLGDRATTSTGNQGRLTSS
jgi:hypothetical protein